MIINEIVKILDAFAPIEYQENYDNCGLIVGNPYNEATSALLCLDITEDIIDEAISYGANLIISHHPIIFSGLKKLVGRNYIERAVIKAIKNNISIYAGHTNFDNINNGVNAKIAEKLGLQNCKILVPKPDDLRKLVTFVPEPDAENVRTAIFNAGAGHIGNYDCCSYNLNGEGTFRASINANPYVGEIGKIHQQTEIRIETIFPRHLLSKVIKALVESHPYEEVAYDIYILENKNKTIGAGMIGELEQEINTIQFLEKIKKEFKTPMVKHSAICKKTIKKIAFCGGSGSFLISDAKAANVDLFLTSDIKYHQFFDAENKIILAEIGHFESEQFTTEIFYDILSKKIPNFAIRFSKINSNPINYL